MCSLSIKSKGADGLRQPEAAGIQGLNQRNQN